jgi:hypothetical protein
MSATRSLTVGDMSADVQLLSAITRVTTAVVLVNLLHQLSIPKDRLIFAVVDNPTLSIAARLAREQWPAGEGRQR